MTINIGQWGNSLGVRIPSSLSEKLDLKKGTKIDIFESKGRIIIKKKETLEDLLAHSPDCPYAEIETDGPVGSEEW